MSNYGRIWHSIANSDHFSTSATEKATYDLCRQWHILHNMSSTGAVWPAVGNGGQLWSRISSLIESVQFMAELRDIGLVYQVIACTALWDEIGQISSKVAYNGWVFVTVSRYDRLGPYLPCITFFEKFRDFLSCLNIFRSRRHVSVKVARNIP